MDRAKFLDAIRPAFGGRLDADQIKGMNALLDAGRGLPLHHMANILAQVRRETGGIMAPIKETVMPWHKDRNPSDAEVIRRLNAAYRAGKLPWVKAPYWLDGWFGRGQIQPTHKVNYDKFGVTKEEALMLHHSARIAVAGMVRGMFTGRKLSDYSFPAALDNPSGTNPRRIVNGPDGSDKQVAVFHRQFAAALQKAGWGESKEERAVNNIFVEDATQDAAPTPVPVLRTGSKGEAVRALQSRLAELRYFVGKIDGVFGPRTHGSVMEFQTDNGLVPDGRVGPQTRAALATAVPRAMRDVGRDDLAESRTIQAAESGKSVTAITTGIAGVGAAVGAAEEAYNVAQRAGNLAQAAATAAPWLLVLLAVAIGGFLIYRRFNRIEAIRIDDARTGANDRL